MEEYYLKLICSGGKAVDAGVRGIYELFARKFLRFFCSQGLSEHDSRDVLQDTMIKIVRNAHTYAGRGAVSSWTWQIARNCLSEYHRREARRAGREIFVDDDEWSGIEAVTPAYQECITAGTVDDCVATGLAQFSQLAPDRAYVLELQMEGNSIEEIALQIGRTPGAAKEYLSQCRKRLTPFIEHCVDLLEGRRE
jgi:RNA polymerase sigma factor (sigma-70 family)